MFLIGGVSGTGMSLPCHRAERNGDPFYSAVGPSGCNESHNQGSTLRVTRAMWARAKTPSAERFFAGRFRNFSTGPAPEHWREQVSHWTSRQRPRDLPSRKASADGGTGPSPVSVNRTGTTAPNAGSIYAYHLGQRKGGNKRHHCRG